MVHARVARAGGYGAEDEDIGVLGETAVRVAELTELITGVGATVLEAARRVAPQEASITFGVELTARAGKVLAVLADAEASASLQVTLVWRRVDQEPASGAEPHG